MIHVMHVIDSLGIGGTERVLVDMVNAFDRIEYSLSVCVTRADASLADEILPHIPVKVLDRQHTWSPLGFLHLREYARQQEVDLYHAHGRWTLSFLLAAKAMGMIHGPILFHDHYGDIEMDAQVPAWFRHWGARHIDYYAGVSDALVNWAVAAGVPWQRTSTMQNALDPCRFEAIPALDLRKEFDLPRQQKIGIMIGNLRPAKGLDLLIEACSRLSKQHLPIFFIVGGVRDPEYVRNCRGLIHDKGLEDHFRFVGEQRNSLTWIKGADLAVLPSRSESGPLVLIEYLACRLPFAAFTVGGIGPMVRQYLPDRFADPGDGSRFGAILERLACLSHEELKTQGEESGNLFLDHFSIQQKIPLWQAIYQQTLERS